MLLVDPGIGGLLLRGGTGTGKSTLARLAAFLHPTLPPEEALVIVPVGSTEDNLLGSPDIALLLGGGGYHIRRGLLERADGRILFLDDIGLHPDTNLDLVLEAAAGGGLDVEREGISARIETRFSLLATWNPSSGQLRPQIVDRFALSAEMDALEQPGQRLAATLAAMVTSGLPDSGLEAGLIARAASARHAIRMPGWLIPASALMCSRLRIDGQRAEIAAVRASICIAALERRGTVAPEDFERASVLALCHRTRMGGSVQPPERGVVIELARDCRRILEQGMGEASRDLDEMTEHLMAGIREAIRTALSGTGTPGKIDAPGFEPIPCGRFTSALRRRSLRALAKVVSRSEGKGRSSAGPGSRMVSGRYIRGRKVRVVPAASPGECDVLPTVRAAIMEKRRLPVVPIPPGIWRRWERSIRPAVTAMILVDSSMSSQAYLQGLGDILLEVFSQFFDPLSKVGLVALVRGNAELVFTPTRNRLRVFGKVKDLVPGGHSPLAQALSIAERELLRARKMEGAKNCFVLMISDCYPEPIPQGTEDIYESAPYRQVRRAASSLGHNKLPVAILDPMNISTDIVESMPGRRLARFVARATSGVLIPVPAEKIRHKGFSLVQLLGVEQDRNRKITQQIASQLEVYRKQQTSPGGPIG